MKLEQQVVSLDLAERLKELGVKQESLYMWYCFTTKDESIGIDTTYKLALGRPHSNSSEISAFTVAELGEMLWSAFEKHGWKLLYKAYGDVFGFKGTSFVGELGIINLMRKPDMGAKMLIYLLEHNLLVQDFSAGGANTPKMA